MDGESKDEDRYRVDLEDLVAGAGESAGETRTEGRCRVTVGMVG